MKILLLILVLLGSSTLQAAVSCTPMGNMFLCVDSKTGKAFTLTRTGKGGE